jgi:hypothetical protein
VTLCHKEQVVEKSAHFVRSGTVNLADVQFAPRIDPRILRALSKLDDPDESIAESRRRLGEVARELGLPRPSYERVRQLVHLHRRSRSRPGSTRCSI